MVTRAAGAQENKCDERRENGKCKITTLGVGQGGSPTKLLTVIHKPRKKLFTTNLDAGK
jgi:hypothetical protein